MINKKQAIVLVIGLVIILILVYYATESTIATISGKVVSSSGSFVKPIITKENFADSLQKQNVIRDLPKNALISLKFYNFNSGERKWEESYTITKASVKKGQAENPDAEIIINSKYIPESYDFCNAIKQANANGDLAYTTNPNIGTISLLWKYKSIIKYKNCFG